MTRGLTLSIVFHLALVVLAFVGLPQLVRPEPMENRLVVVDVVTVGAVTNAPPPAEQAKKPDAPTQSSKAKPDAPRTPPPPPASAAAPPPPPAPKVEAPKIEAPAVEVPRAEPQAPTASRTAPPRPQAPPVEPAPAPAARPQPAEPVPAPKPEAVAKAEPVPLPKPQEVKPRQPDAEAIPLPKPKPQDARKPEPEPEAPKPVEVTKPEPPKPEPAKPAPEAVQAADATPAPAPPLPVSRPTPPARPAKEQVAKATPPAPDQAKPEKSDDFLNVLKTVQKMKDSASQPAETAQDAPKTTDSTARRSTFDADRPLSVSEMDAIRQQIARCWLVPAGAKEGASLLVEIRVQMNADRTVRAAEIVDSSRLRSDPFFRAAAESALRALRNPVCTPLNLPPEKYDTWKNFTITFDPRDMLS